MIWLTEFLSGLIVVYAESWVSKGVVPQHIEDAVPQPGPGEPRLLPRPQREQAAHDPHVLRHRQRPQEAAARHATRTDRTKLSSLNERYRHLQKITKNIYLSFLSPTVQCIFWLSEELIAILKSYIEQRVQLARQGWMNKILWKFLSSLKSNFWMINFMNKSNKGRKEISCTLLYSEVRNSSIGSFRSRQRFMILIKVRKRSFESASCPTDETTIFHQNLQ